LEDIVVCPPSHFPSLRIASGQRSAGGGSRGVGSRAERRAQTPGLFAELHAAPQQTLNYIKTHLDFVVIRYVTRELVS